MLVVDAGVAVAAAFAGNAFCELHDDDLVAPALRWSDARSTLRLRAWHGRVHPDDVEPARACLERCPVDRREPGELGHEAWRVADEMGWARTYYAEYVALARLLDCRLVMLDSRLRRAADRLGLVVSPAEL